ncbi:MAG: GatB/YqeY domain-containing protein [Tepidiformaceae bacterium]
MPTLKERIQSELHDALRARDEIRKSTLRMLTAAVHNAEIEVRHPLDDEGVLTVVQKQAKQRRESIAEFARGNRADLVAREEAELAILQTYLPEQAGRDEIQAAARKLIAETGAATERDIGKVMPPLLKQLAGRADGRVVNEVVRSLLGG